MAGMAGLEPADVGVKVPCLTTWRHPCVEKERGTGITPNPSSSCGVGNGTRTHDTRNHNPVLLPTELYPPHGTPKGIRTPDLLLRRQLLYPAELLAHIVERVMGIEPTRPAWKAGILPLNYTRRSFGVDYDTTKR